jgi:hypothetical protein
VAVDKPVEGLFKYTSKDQNSTHLLTALLRATQTLRMHIDSFVHHRTVTPARRALRLSGAAGARIE